MEKPSLIYSLFLVLVLFVMGLFVVENYIPLVYLTAVLISGGIFTFFRISIGFAILIIEVIGSGLLLTYDAYESKLSSVEQLPLVLDHLFFSGIISVLWIIFYLLKRDAKRFSQMERDLAELKRVEEQTNLFTKKEFIEKARVIWGGLRRRKERGVLLYVSIDSSSHHTEKALTKTIGHTLLRTVRGNYDVVGKYDTDTFIILLQNTDDRGKDIVLERFKRLLKERVSEPESLFTVREEDMNDDFFEADLLRGDVR